MMFDESDIKKAVESARQLILSELRYAAARGLADPIVPEMIGGGSPEFFYDCVLIFANKQAVGGVVTPGNLVSSPDAAARTTPGRG